MREVSFHIHLSSVLSDTEKRDLICGGKKTIRLKDLIRLRGGGIVTYPDLRDRQYVEWLRENFSYVEIEEMIGASSSTITYWSRKHNITQKTKKRK
ncbi:MAG: hypothetical protein D5R96_07725 [Methanocalculus sp. MSAO_Arc2]|uniref:hypothetical protein n=1 Tax=Methanocalculus sp. MSAO_Arc2 TaxID=2293855 RepID=UPI000FF4D84A|nr:MAG: hypothetical protein D5R96_07725 [Methanocalculus sp. MSAO_Arc2]